jgi:hypothetical protein
MEQMNGILVRHTGLARLAWLIVILVLAACNDGSGGGDGGY